MNPLNWDAPIFWIWLALLVIVIFRAGGTYVLGRLIRRGAAESQRINRVLASPMYLKAAGFIERYGAPVVAVSFLTVGFQTAANLAAGVTRMSLWRYLPALLVGGSGWALIYATIGFVGVQAVIAAFQRWPVITVIALVSAIVVLISTLFITNRRHRHEQPVPAPTAESR